MRRRSRNSSLVAFAATLWCLGGRVVAAELPPSLGAKLGTPAEYKLAPPKKARRSTRAVQGDPLQVGVHRALPPRAVHAGAWDSVPGGRRIWRLAVSSPGAAALRVHFTEFSA